MAESGRPFFIPPKELELFDAMNEELIDELIGQTVDIYKVSMDDTDSNIYGESVDGNAKYFEKGFRVNCLILFNAPETELNEFGSDLNTSIEVYFHRNSLKESDFYPEIGDIIDWNDFYWELNSVSEPQLIAGNPDYNHSIITNAHRVRLSNVNFSSRPR